MSPAQHLQHKIYSWLARRPSSRVCAKLFASASPTDSSSGQTSLHSFQTILDLQPTAPPSTCSYTAPNSAPTHTVANALIPPSPALQLSPSQKPPALNDAAFRLLQEQQNYVHCVRANSQTNAIFHETRKQRRSDTLVGRSY
jgi:hypothetical protein